MLPGVVGSVLIVIKTRFELKFPFHLRSGSGDSVIYADVDAHSRNRIILCDMLPAESASKQSDAALLPTLSWPAYAMHIEPLRSRTLQRIVETLEGRYGFKRFLRDGYKTVVEDSSRKQYEAGEMMVSSDSCLNLIRLLLVYHLR